jgi:hypothetical protein
MLPSALTKNDSARVPGGQLTAVRGIWIAEFADVQTKQASPKSHVIFCITMKHPKM